MPNVLVPIPAIRHTVYRPVMRQIIEKLKRVSLISKDTGVLLREGEEETFKFTDSFYRDERVETPGSNPNDAYILVTTDTILDEESVSTTPVRSDAHPAFWRDPEIRMHLRPVYVRADIVFNITYVSSSREDVYRWYHDLRLKVSQLADINIHDVEYTYMLPGPLLNLLRDVYKLRNEVEVGRWHTFLDYVLYGSTGRLRGMSDMMGDKIELGIDEKQSRIVGQYGFSPLPDKPEYDSDKSKYKVSFEYRVSIEVPVAIKARYPVLICNQLLPSKYVLPTETNNDVEDRPRYTSGTMDGLHTFESTLSNHTTPLGYVRIPGFDDWIIPHTIEKHVPVLSVLAAISKDDRRTLFNLDTDIEPFTLSPVLLDWLRSGEYQYLSKPYFSIFYLQLYRDDKLIDWDTLEITSSLTIQSKVDLQLCKTYHVVLNLLVDVSILQDRMLKVFIDRPDILYIYLRALNEDYVNHPHILNRIVKRKPSKEDVVTVLRYYIDNINNLNTSQLITGRKTVQLTSIYALKK